MTLPITVRLTNSGTDVSTPGNPALSGWAPQDYSVTNDACAGAPLAPGATCDVTLTFAPQALGGRSARLDVPMAGHPRATGAATWIHGVAVAPPATPTALVSFRTLEGVGLHWSSPANEATSFTVYRRPTAGSEWVALGSAPLSRRYEDLTLSSGSSAEYAVAAVNEAGESAKSSVSTNSRPAVAPAVGSVNVVTVDSPPSSLLGTHRMDSAVAGTQVTASASNGIMRIQGDASGRSAQVTIPVVPGPGTYPMSSGALQVTAANASCWATSGDLVVDEAVYDMEQTPITFTGEYRAACALAPEGDFVRGSLRWHATSGYQAAAITPAASPWRSPVGTGADYLVTLTSLGSLPVEFGGAAVTGSAAGDVRVLSNQCDSLSLSGGSSCNVTLRATPSVAGARTATLDVMDSTARGKRSTVLTLTGTTVPEMPADLAVSSRIGASAVGWSVPADGGSPISTYRVYRRLGEAAPVLLAETSGLPVTTAGLRSYTDTTATAGQALRYGIAAVNAVGASATAWSGAVTSPASEVLFGRATTPDSWGLSAVTAGSASVFPDAMAATDDIYTPAVSPSGREIVYTAPTSGGDYDLWIRSAVGTTAPRRLTTLAGLELDAAWSPDGKSIAFTHVTSAFVPSVYSVAAAGGTPVKRGEKISDPAWLADSRSLVVTDIASEAAPLSILSPTNTRMGVSGTAGGYAPAVSPDGSRIAFNTENDEASVGIAIVPVTGAPSPTTYFHTYRDFYGPSWRGDGQALVAESYDWWNDVSRIAELTVAGNQVTSRTDLTEGSSDTFPVYRSVGLELTSAPTVTRTTATVSFTLAAPYATAQCSLDAAAPTACSTGTWTRTSLSAGKHTLVITASAPGLPTRVLGHTWTVDSAGPAISVSSPSTLATLAKSVVFAYKGVDPVGVASYDVRYRKAPTGATYGAHASSAGWLATTATQVTLAVSPGWEYCFSVRARDTVGNVSAYSTERCVASPLDDRALTASAGWTRSSAAGSYLSTFTGTTRLGATMTRAGVQARRIVLVATKCSTCGTVGVYLGTTLVGSVNLAASTTQRAVQITVAQLTTLRSGTVTIKVTSSGKTVQIDGLGIRRS
jgi:hypothetical protein